MSDDLNKIAAEQNAKAAMAWFLEYEENATALAAAQAEIARLRAQIATASFALGGHEVLEPNLLHSGNRNDLIACALWDLCKAARAALSPQTQEG